MPAARSRAAMAVATGPLSCTSVAALTSSLSSLRVASSRSLSSSSLSSSSLPSSSSSASLPSLPSSRAPLRCCRHQRPSLPASVHRRPRISSSSTHSSFFAAPAAFSTTPVAMKASTRRRQAMREFLETVRPLKLYKPGQPASREMNWTMFPYNPSFRPQAVVGPRTRELVWSKVVRNGESVKGVAAELGMDMRRVAAVVRLKEIEKSWIAEGKPLAKAYANAVLDMMPHTKYGSVEQATSAFEPINEIPTHSYTKQQLFLPVAESRHFTRKDAAHAFHPTLLPADKRMPIPELIDVEKKAAQDGGGVFDRGFGEFLDKAMAEQDAMAKREQEKVAAEDARTAKVDTGRFQFRIRDYNAESVGSNGRSPRAVGWRYGAPFNDRKRGQIKIPTSVG